MSVVCLPPRYMTKWLCCTEVGEFHADIVLRQHLYLRSLRPTEAVPGQLKLARDILRRGYYQRALPQNVYGSISNVHHKTNRPFMFRNREFLDRFNATVSSDCSLVPVSTVS
jgi:hypothetical protein